MLIDESVGVEGLDAPKMKTGVSLEVGQVAGPQLLDTAGNLSTGNFFPMAVILHTTNPDQPN